MHSFPIFLLNSIRLCSSGQVFWEFEYGAVISFHYCTCLWDKLRILVSHVISPTKTSHTSHRNRNHTPRWITSTYSLLPLPTISHLHVFYRYRTELFPVLGSVHNRYCLVPFPTPYGICFSVDEFNFHRLLIDFCHGIESISKASVSEVVSRHDGDHPHSTNPWYHPFVQTRQILLKIVSYPSWKGGLIGPNQSFTYLLFSVTSISLWLFPFILHGRRGRYCAEWEIDHWGCIPSSTNSIVQSSECLSRFQYLYRRRNSWC